MKVLLSHCPNPDVRSGYWSQVPMRRPQPKFVACKSLGDASRLCREYIEKYELGSGNWTGGEVIDETNNLIAKISYNGRIWPIKGGEVKV